MKDGEGCSQVEARASAGEPTASGGTRGLSSTLALDLSSLTTLACSRLNLCPDPTTVLRVSLMALYDGSTENRPLSLPHDVYHHMPSNTTSHPIDRLGHPYRPCLVTNLTV